MVPSLSKSAIAQTQYLQTLHHLTLARAVMVGAINVEQIVQHALDDLALAGRAQKLSQALIPVKAACAWVMI